MLIKFLFVAALIFLVGRNLLKILDNSPKQEPKPKKKDDGDIIDADYTVIDDDK